MESINQRVLSLRALLPPSCVFEELPGNIATYTQVIDTRQAIINMVAGKDDRLLVVVGPAGAPPGPCAGVQGRRQGAEAVVPAHAPDARPAHPSQAAAR